MILLSELKLTINQISDAVFSKLVCRISIAAAKKGTATREQQTRGKRRIESGIYRSFDQFELDLLLISTN